MFKCLLKTLEILDLCCFHLQLLKLEECFSLVVALVSVNQKEGMEGIRHRW